MCSSNHLLHGKCCTQFICPLTWNVVTIYHIKCHWKITTKSKANYRKIKQSEIYPFDSPKWQFLCCSFILCFSLSCLPFFSFSHFPHLVYLAFPYLPGPWFNTWYRCRVTRIGIPCGNLTGVRSSYTQCFRPLTFSLNIGLNMFPLDSFMLCLHSLLGYSTGEFQALRLIVPAAFGAVD